MSFKKNAVSYTIWILFIMCNCIVFAFLSMICAKQLPVVMPVGALGLCTAFFGLLLLLYLLTGRISECFHKKSTGIEQEKKFRSRLITEGIITVLVFALGIGIRVYMLPDAGETAAYYDIAKVTQEGSGLMVPVQNSVYYYLCLLRGIFILLGNHWIAGIWLQIILQILGCIVLYFVVRRLAGVIAAVFSLSYMMFSPVWIREALNYSPQMLYFLIWSVGFLFVMLYLSRSTKSGKREFGGYRLRMWLGAFFLGIVIGFVSYMDISGAILIVPVLFLPAVCGKSEGISAWIGRTALVIVIAFLSFIGFIYLDSLLSGATFRGVLNAWLLTFVPKMPNVVSLLQRSSAEVLVLLSLMAVNVFAFYRRKGSEIVTPWIMMTMAMAVLYVFGLTTESMNGRSLLFALMSVVGAIGIRELFYVNPVKEDYGGQENEVEVEVVTETEKEAVVEDTEVVNEAVTPEKPIIKPRFIENPLPIPKKHVKKVMDYAFAPDAAMMKYDLEVAETDDFDI